MKCPGCQQEIDDVIHIDAREPFTAFDPWQGLSVWGPADVPKELVCCTGQWAHIRFTDDGAERLVRMLRAG